MQDVNYLLWQHCGNTCYSCRHQAKELSPPASSFPHDLKRAVGSHPWGQAALREKSLLITGISGYFRILQVPWRLPSIFQRVRQSRKRIKAPWANFVLGIEDMARRCAFHGPFEICWVYTQMGISASVSVQQARLCGLLAVNLSQCKSTK